jgi:CelD/BcsL family acetyltransferase involved in cellulose biosynthesis
VLSGPTAELRLEPASDLADVRSEWTKLALRAGSVFGTWEWADTWHRHLGAGAQMALAIGRGPTNDPVAVLPLCVPRVRPVRVLRFIGAGPSDELGPICAAEDRPAASAALRRHVAECSAGGGIFLGERLWGGHWPVRELGGTVVSRTANPVLPASGRSFDEFLSSRTRNFRDQVRRRERKLARAAKLSYRLTQDPGQLDADMSTLIRLHQARWSEGESNAFAGARTPFHIEFARRALENGWLRLWTMELDGAPVASWYGFRYAGVETYYQAGRDPEFDAQNVGFVLLCHSIRSALDDGVREYRFGSGNEAYKSRFAEQDPGLETVVVPIGTRGRIAEVAIRLALRMPKSTQQFARRLGGRERDAV